MIDCQFNFCHYYNYRLTTQNFFIKAGISASRNLKPFNFQVPQVASIIFLIEIAPATAAFFFNSESRSLDLHFFTAGVSMRWYFGGIMIYFLTIYFHYFIIQKRNSLTTSVCTTNPLFRTVFCFTLKAIKIYLTMTALLSLLVKKQPAIIIKGRIVSKN